MPIQPMQFQLPTFDQSNPMLAGVKAGVGISSDLSGLISKNLEQQTSRQALQWNPKIWQSEIGLRGAQAGLASQQAQWVGPQAQAEITKNKAQAGVFGVQAQKEQYLVDALKKSLIDQGVLRQDGTLNSGNNLSQTNSSGSVGMPAMGGSAQSQPSQPSQQQPSQQQDNILYGITIPKMTSEDMVNKLVYGTDSYSTKLNAATDLSKQQALEFNKGITEAVKASQVANQNSQLLTAFNQAMDKSRFKGPWLGHTPIMPGMDNEQTSDSLSALLTPNAASNLRDAMGTARFSNLDMMYAKQGSVDRTLGDAARRTRTMWGLLANQRAQEIPKMMTTLMESKQLTKSEADTLVQEYQNQNPLISDPKDDKYGNQYALPENSRKWHAYVTPKAIQSIRTTGSYTPSKAALSAVYMKNNVGVVVPVKFNKVAKALKLGYTTV